jgi:twitching motility protein PilT
MEHDVMSMPELLKTLHEQGGSDLHLKVGRPPLMRVRGDLVPMPAHAAVGADDVERLIDSVMNADQRARLRAERELDFSFAIPGVARFRGNVFFRMGIRGAVFRLIPAEVPTPEELGLPEVLKELALRKQGLFLVTGPTGSGKSTTLAAIIDHINRHVPGHIITLEDPIEFVYEDRMAVINQREVGADTRNFAEGLRRALRQDPNVILVGEMRDAETITTALDAAETGHLVLATLHTNDARQSIDRILDSYAPEAQQQIRMQVAKCLLAVVSQRLLKRADGRGRVAVHEIMINTPLVQKLIEEGKISALGKAIEDSVSLHRMQSLDQDLLQKIKANVITAEEALAVSRSPNDLRIALRA